MKQYLERLSVKLNAFTMLVLLVTVPTSVNATAPSSYVNKISDGLFAEILKVAPKIALVVIGFSFLMYIVAGDEHKKSKHKSTAYIAIVAYLILLVLQPLLGWLDGLI